MMNWTFLSLGEKSHPVLVFAVCVQQEFVGLGLKIDVIEAAAF